MDKGTIREKSIAARKSITPQQHSEWSALVCNNLLGLGEISLAQNLALYLSKDESKEVSTKKIVATLFEYGKQVAVPCMSGNKIFFSWFRKGESTLRNSLGFDEPVERREAQPSLINVFIIPGVAFDRHGTRIGHGEGFYDKFFGENKVKRVKIGLAFESQISEKPLPKEKHDVPVDIVVTEKNVYRKPES